MEPVPSVTMTPEWIITALAAVTSLIFSYFPKLNAWYASLDDGSKQLIMLGLMIAIVASVFALGCLGVIQVNEIACTRDGIIQLVWQLILAVAVNQGVHRISPKTPTVRSLTE